MGGRVSGDQDREPEKVGNQRKCERVLGSGAGAAAPGLQLFAPAVRPPHNPLQLAASRKATLWKLPRRVWSKTRSSHGWCRCRMSSTPTWLSAASSVSSGSSASHPPFKTGQYPSFGVYTAHRGGVGGLCFLLSLGRPGRWMPSDRATGLFTSAVLTVSLGLLKSPVAKVGAVCVSSAVRTASCTTAK